MNIKEVTVNSEREQCKGNPCEHEDEQKMNRRQKRCSLDVQPLHIEFERSIDVQPLHIEMDEIRGSLIKRRYAHIHFLFF